MKKIWGIIGVIIIIAGITAGRLYKKYQRQEMRQEQQMSAEEARQIIENQRQAELETQLAEQKRVRDSAIQAQQDLRQQQLDELKAIQEKLQNEIDAGAK